MNLNTRRQAVCEAALEYGRSGLKVVPLVPDTKRPAQEDWVERATADPKRNRQRFARHDRNLGILMGPTADGRFVFALDDDMLKKGHGRGAFTRWLAGRPLPETATALTPAGGTHRLYYAPAGVIVTSHTGDHALAPGIDVIGAGGHVVAEPSTIAGKAYVWTRLPSRGIAEAPAWLIALIVAKQGKAAGAPTRPPGEPPALAPVSIVKAAVPGDEGALLRDALARFEVPGPGRRNAQLYRLVSSLICQGADDATTLLVARAWWEHWHAQGTAGDPVNDTQIGRQIRCTRNALARGKLTPSGGRNHEVELASRSLSPAQEEAVSSLIIIRTLVGPERRAMLCAGKLDRAFVGACLLHFSYERSKDPSPHLRATNAQIRELMARKFGVEVTDNNFRVLKARFTSKSLGDGKYLNARRCPLLTMLEQGNRTGGEVRPSLYRLEPLFLELLGLGEDRRPSPVALRSPVAADDGITPTKDVLMPETREAPVLGFGEGDGEGAGWPPQGADAPHGGAVVGLRLAAPPPAVEVPTLAFPARPGLTEIVRTLIDSGRFDPDEVAGMLRDIRPAQASRSSRRDE